MPHTISPTPDSHGLGIQQSTLTPAPAAPAARFTDAGFGPRPSPTRQTSALSALSSGSGYSAGSRPSSAGGPAPSSPSRGAPLYQPTFALRPTHSREAFTSFAALAPGTRSAGNSPARPPPARSEASSSSSSLRAPRLRASKSSDLLARFTRDGANAYQQIPDDAPERGPAPEAAEPRTALPPPPRARSGTTSTVVPTPSSASHAMFARQDWPTPPGNVPHPAASPARMLPRSHSTPLALGPAPEQPSTAGQAHPHPFFTRPDHTPQPQRNSDPMATHARNAALYAAGEQGAMVAFSPSGGVRPATTAGTLRSELEARPWSESTQSPHLGGGVSRGGGHRPRALSDGAAMLARQGTLFHPASSKERSAAELGVMLGGRARRLSQGKLLPAPEQAELAAREKVRLEAAKKGKARVEVDVVLERECVVEGGEIRGRLEVLVRGGKRGEGLRVGGGKVRVLGYEDVNASARHIFYHQQHALPLFDVEPAPGGPSSSLFGSAPDSEGYRLAVDGMHAIPFRVRLPLGGGAKGAYTSAGKGPSVRYVVVGSVKLHIPGSGKRAIAHFYRPVTILPYLNPSVVLAPAPEPITARVESGLGWSLTGEKGRVEVRVALGRPVWVCGQRAWCEVSVRNDSGKKVNKIALALLQTVSVYDSQAEVEGCARRPAAVERTHVDAAATSTSRRKVAEEVLEADFADRGAGRVTGKGWWTGVEPGERGQWDMSLQIPAGMVSIHRSRLVEVAYMLRVTVNGSIYVDVPIELINFLSMDPPPMPGDAPRLVSPQAAAHAVYGAVDTLSSARTPARASSTTLHLDALLQEGRARAEAGQGRAGDGSGSREVLRSRPMSMGSDYSGERAGLSRGPSTVRPPHGSRGESYRSARTGESEGAASDDDGDRALMEARRRQGRQISLALIQAVRDDAAADAAADGHASGDDAGEAFRPDRTPSERQFHVADTPSVDTHEGATPMPPSSHAPGLDAVDELADVMDMVASNGASTAHEDDRDVGIDDRSPTLVLGDTSYDIYAEMGLAGYGREGSVRSHMDEATPRASPAPTMDDALAPPAYPQHRLNSVVSVGSGSELESELGQVYEATRGETARPARLFSLDAADEAAQPRRGSHTPQPLRHDSASPEPRRGSGPHAPHLAGPGRRESNASPLRPHDVPRASFSFGSMPAGAAPRRPSAALLSPSTSPRSLPHAYLDQRRPSTSSMLRHEVPIQTEPPGLAPSAASDSASSDGHLESPALSGEGGGGDGDGEWQPPAAPSLSGDAHDYDAPPSPASSSHTHATHTTHATHATHASVESMLPGVRSKIAQLESRDEALRKFSVASAASLHADPAAAAAPLPPPAHAPPAPPHHVLAKRQSYTAALAPRPVRSASDDAADRVGHTTFVARPKYASRQSQGQGRGTLERTPSMCSNSTTATDVERALMRSPPSGGGGGVGGPRGPRPLSKLVAPLPLATPTEGYAYEEFGRPGVIGKDEAGSYGSTGWRGGAGLRLPPLGFARGSIANDSEESEGLL